jgi:hypothetical protein
MTSNGQETRGHDQKVVEDLIEPLIDLSILDLGGARVRVRDHLAAVDTFHLLDGR